MCMIAGCADLSLHPRGVDAVKLGPKRCVQCRDGYADSAGVPPVCMKSTF